MKTMLRVTQLLSENDFSRVGMFMKGGIFSIDNASDTEYLRFFSPRLIERKGHKVLVGLLGSLERRAIAEWSNISRLSDYFVLSIYSGNFPALVNPPFFGISNEADREWCARVVAIVEQFPTTYAQLEHLLGTHSEIAGVKVSQMDV